MKRTWRLGAICLVLILAALLVLVMSASSWLETASGRNLLQRELGKGLGMLATLEGDYQLRIFPRIRISGQRLLLHDPAETRPLAVMDSYELHLALWPLLRKQVLIHKVAVHDGSLDLDLLATLGDDQDVDDQDTLTLPRITDLEITGLALIKSSEVLVTISRLGLQDFAANQDSRFSISLLFPSTDNTSNGISLAGLLRVQASPLELRLDADLINLDLNGKSWPLGTGQLAWLHEQGELTGNVEGALAGYDAEYEVALQIEPALQLQLKAGLQAKDKGPLAVQLRVSDGGGVWLIDSLELDLAGQQLAGTGCFSTADKARLQLQLSASQLDLDALQQLIPADLLGEEATDSANPSTPVSLPAQENLPVELAVSVQAEQATLSGAVARDVQLQLGEQPDCSSAQTASED